MADAANSKHMCTTALEYISVACNRTPLCVDWGRNGLVAYGACHSVALYRPKEDGSLGKVENILHGHKERVNCAKWISQLSFGLESDLVSGSTDKTILVWQKKSKWEVSQVLKGHQEAVNCVDAVRIPSTNAGESERTIIVSASADSTLRIWSQTEQGGSFSCIQTVSFGKGFILAIAISILPETKVPVLACGGEDSKIHLFVERDDKFIKVQSLLGHEDWIRGVEFTVDDDCNLLLSSCSQDGFIRIWKISCSTTMALSEPHSIHNDLGELKLTSNLFHINETGREIEFSVVLESVLTGHEGWVYSVHWQPKVRKADGGFTQPMALLSASMDKTLILWKPEPNSGVWLEKVRVGEVGGTTLGFYGAVFSPNGQAILGHGYQGAFHLWNNVGTEEEERWEPGVTVGGHFGPVQDIDWDPVGGQFLVSVSSDQTTRLHAPWKKPGSQPLWCEIARPQVHGYDMHCLSMLSRFKFVSGADEKVVRVFNAPCQFMDSLQVLCGVQQNEQIRESLPIGASVPALGLSNKAVFQGDIESLRRDLEDPSRPMKSSAFASEEPAPFTPVSLKEPPTEDILHQNTLWPEAHKLYGHGFEIFCVAASPDGSLLASACKASKPEHAAVILWDTKSWRQICLLASHTLTVTQMAFDHSGQRLLTVSRDRCWSVFKKKSENEEGPLFSLAARSDKSNQHARIIWSCTWSGDDKHFATASRDKKVIIWGDKDPGSEQWHAVSSPLDVGEPATAVDIAPTTLSETRYLLAVGTESGVIHLCTWTLFSEANQWCRLRALDQSLCHVLTVRRLRWKRQFDSTGKTTLQLASCSLDHSVRIFNVILAS